MGFREDSYWSPRVTAVYLEKELGPIRNWRAWLDNDRRRDTPKLAYERVGDWAILYRQIDVEGFVQRVRDDAVSALGRV